jgi:hypothetical protein
MFAVVNQEREGQWSSGWYTPEVTCMRESKTSVPGRHCACLRSLVPDLDLARVALVRRRLVSALAAPQIAVATQRSETAGWAATVLRSMSKDGSDALLAIAFGCSRRSSK